MRRANDRGLRDAFEKRLAAHAPQARAVQRGDAGRARTAIDGGHVAEDLPGTEIAEDDLAPAGGADDDAHAAMTMQNTSSLSSSKSRISSPGS